MDFPIWTLVIYICIVILYKHIINKQDACSFAKIIICRGQAPRIKELYYLSSLHKQQPVTKDNTLLNSWLFWCCIHYKFLVYLYFNYTVNWIDFGENKWCSKQLNHAVFIRRMKIPKSAKLLIQILKGVQW